MTVAKKIFEWLKDTLFPPIEGDAFCWWKSDLTARENIIRLLKSFGDWVLDLLFPVLDDDQY